MAEAASKPKRGPSGNIEPIAFPELSWRSDIEVGNALASLYKYAEARAETTIAWYMQAKASKSFGSRCLRLMTITLGTLGGLAPIVGSAGIATSWLPPGAEVTEVGFLLLGLAAACVAVDKLFGLSSGWMRYITTAMAIQEDLALLRMDWAAMSVRSRARPLSTGDILHLLDRLKAFLEALDGRVMQETRAWIAEFQSNLTDIERSTSAGPVRVLDRPTGVRPVPLPPVQREVQTDAPVVDTRPAPAPAPAPVPAVEVAVAPQVEAAPVIAPVPDAPT